MSNKHRLQIRRVKELPSAVEMASWRRAALPWGRRARQSLRYFRFFRLWSRRTRFIALITTLLFLGLHLYRPHRTAHCDSGNHPFLGFCLQAYVHHLMLLWKTHIQSNSNKVQKYQSWNFCVAKHPKEKKSRGQQRGKRWVFDLEKSLWETNWRKMGFLGGKEEGIRGKGSLVIPLRR